MANSKNSITQLIQGQLSEFKFNGHIPDRSNLNDDELEKIASSFNKKIVTKKVVGEAIGDFAFQEVLDKVKSDEKVIKKFAQFTEVDFKKVADSIYLFISSLPQKYTFIFKMPKSTVNFGKVTFRHGIELKVVDDAMLKVYEKDTSTEQGLRGLLASMASGRADFVKGDVVLTVSGNGYVGEYGRINVNVVDPVYIFKVIIGIYLALGIINARKDTEYLRIPYEYSYKVYDRKNNLVRTITESTEDARYLNGVEFNAEKFVPSELEKLLNKKTTDFEKANKILSHLLTTVYKPSKNQRPIVLQRMVKNGAFWFYETVKSSQEHEQVIFLTTAFDSLISLKGSDDNKGYKAEFVSNLIGNNAFDADLIRPRIIELYDLRNKIVHGERPVYAIEKYGELDKNSLGPTIWFGLSYFSRFLFNRIYFVDNGLTKIPIFKQK